MSQRFSGSITGTGVASGQITCNRVAVSIDFGTGTVDLEWSLDGGITWRVYKSYTADANEVLNFGLPVIIRLNCSAYTSSIAWNLLV